MAGAPRAARRMAASAMAGAPRTARRMAASAMAGAPRAARRMAASAGLMKLQKVEIIVETMKNDLNQVKASLQATKDELNKLRINYELFRSYSMLFTSIFFGGAVAFPVLIFQQEHRLKDVCFKSTKMEERLSKLEFDLAIEEKAYPSHIWTTNSASPTSSPSKNLPVSEQSTKTTIAS